MLPPYDFVATNRDTAKRLADWTLVSKLTDSQEVFSWEFAELEVFPSSVCSPRAMIPKQSGIEFFRNISIHQSSQNLTLP
jgi:hypothetical protein